MRTADPLCRIPANWLQDPSLCWFEWQALLAGLLALAVGALTIWIIRRQIEQQDELHRANRQALFKVAKAKTPLAAIEVAEHAKAYMSALEELLPAVLDMSSEIYNFKGPRFPEQAEKILDALVEFSDKEILIDQVSALYSEHQVMSSRLADVRPIELTACINDYLLQPIMMDAIAMNLLAFGRDGEEMCELSWDDVERSAKRLISREPTRSHLLAYVSGEKKSEKPVPLALRRHNG